MKSFPAGVLVLLLAVTSCAPAGSRTNDGIQSAGRPDQNRTLVVAVRGEPAGLSSKEFVESLGLGNTKRFFNANLTLTDHLEQRYPYLAETLPQLNTDSWRVLPDRKMETVYQLRPNLTWHDGAPLTAEDFVFAARVYLTPELGQARLAPQLQMEEVLAPDPRTVLIRWKQLYPEAGTLTTGFQPLPRHILEAPFRDMAPNAFVALPFWSREYVGLGPYRVEAWEPGAFITGTAFEGHALGRPQIQQVQIRFIPDPNTQVANLLAEAVHVSLDLSLGFTQGAILQKEWGPRNAGSVIFTPTAMRWMQVQFRPEIVNPKALLDVRVRRALLHSLDRLALGNAMYEGQGKPLDAMVYPHEPWFEAVDRAVVKYPYDLRRAEQLMSEAGFARGADGTYTSAAEGRFNAELRISAGDENEREVAILAEGFRKAGFNVTEYPYPVALTRDGEFRATFPGLLQNPAGGGASSLISSGIPSTENRWSGANRGGWSNPDYDRLYEAFQTSLDPNERNQQMAQLMRISSEQLSVLPIEYSFTVIAFVTGLQGPLSTNSPNWNAHLWEWRKGN